MMHHVHNTSCIIYSMLHPVKGSRSATPWPHVNVSNASPEYGVQDATLYFRTPQPFLRTPSACHCAAAEPARRSQRYAVYPRSACCNLSAAHSGGLRDHVLLGRSRHETGQTACVISLRAFPDGGILVQICGIILEDYGCNLGVLYILIVPPFIGLTRT